MIAFTAVIIPQIDTELGIPHVTGIYHTFDGSIVQQLVGQTITILDDQEPIGTIKEAWVNEHKQVCVFGLVNRDTERFNSAVPIYLIYVEDANSIKHDISIKGVALCDLPYWPETIIIHWETMYLNKKIIRVLSRLY